MKFNRTSILFVGCAVATTRLVHAIHKLYIELGSTHSCSSDTIMTSPEIESAIMVARQGQFIGSTNLSLMELSGYEEKFAANNIEVVCMPQNPQKFLHPEDDWARSWNIYKNQNFLLDEIRERIKISNNLFAILSLDRPADREKLISIYLTTPKINLSNQVDVHGCQEYVRQLTAEIFAVLPVSALLQLVIEYLFKFSKNQ